MNIKLLIIIISIFHPEKRSPVCLFLLKGQSWPLKYGGDIAASLYMSMFLRSSFVLA